MPDTKHCEECGGPLPAYWPRGLCAQCAIDGALDMSNAGARLLQPEKLTTTPADLKPPGSGAEGSPLGSLGEYDLLEEIARGGMGVVYKARQRQLGRLVAVKMILAGSLAGKEFVQRFRTESSAAAILQHPNIVAIHDVGVHDGRHYFSMDYVDGQNLAQLVGQQPLAPARAARYVETIAAAIHYAHERGILHRDLKPSNVLIDANDQPRITDFGLARRLDGDSSLTLTGQVLGSPNFMPPEQAGGGRGKVGRPSDVYAIGGILYYLLTARAPFQAESLEHTIDQVLNVDPVAPRLLNPSVPRDLETITLKCLEKEPSRRYQSAQELADELGRFLRGEPIHARPITAPQKLWRWGRRKPVLALLIVLLHVVGACGLTGIVWQWRRAERLAGAERQERIAGQRQLYVASMNLVQAAWEQNHVSRAKQLLEDTATSPERGFEWYYWQRPMHQELKTLRGHTGPILGLAYSPDGRRIVTASADHFAKVWDAASGTELLTLSGHTGPVRSVVFFPDGQRIVTGSWDTTARVWDATGGRLHILEGHRKGIFSVAVSTNGQRIATGSLDHTARIWDATSGTCLLRFTNHAQGVWGVAFSPDGRRVVSGSWDKTTRVWDANSGKELIAPVEQTDAVFSVVFSPDGQSIVTGGKDGTVRLWDAWSGAHRQTFEGHQRPVFSVSFSPDGRRIISGSDDQTAREWDIATGKPLRLLKGHGSRIGSVAYSPDGQRIITGGGAVRISPNGEDVDFTVGDDNAAKVWDATENGEMYTLKANDVPVVSVDFSPNGKLIASGSMDGAVRLWDLGSRGEMWVRTNNAAVRSVAFFPDGRRMVTGCFDHTATVWEVASGKELFRLAGHTNRLFSVAVSPNGHWIATGSWDSTVRLWDAASGRHFSTLRGYGASVYPVAFSRDSRRLVSGSRDGVTTVWDVLGGTNIFRLKQSGTIYGTIWSAAFSHNDRRIVTGSHGLSATVWDATTGEKQITLSGHTAHIHAAVFSPDDSRILTGSADYTAKLWDSTTGGELLTFRGHTGSVFSAAFSPDGQRIVTGSEDGTVKVWDAAIRDQVAK